MTNQQKLTPEQQKDWDRNRRYIEREQLASVMCNTKWSRLVKLLQSLPFSTTYRRKDVRDPERADERWDGEVEHVFGGRYVSIEWIEINAVRRRHLGPFARPELAIVADHTSDLKQALLDAMIPFSMENGVVRVWGYTRPGVSPCWVLAST